MTWMPRASLWEPLVIAITSTYLHSVKISWSCFYPIFLCQGGNIVGFQKEVQALWPPGCDHPL